MGDEVIYRCVSAGCARALPRRVRFCPYCGSAQQAAVPGPAPAPAPVPGPTAFARPSAGGRTAAAPPAQPAPEQRMPPPPPMPPAPAARPRQPKPVRLRYWLLALAVPWLIWIVQKPNVKKTEARIDQAIAMASACRYSAAEAELVALKSAHATAAQLQRLQAALDRALPACERQRASPLAGTRPRARAPADSAPQQAQSARNLIASAERDIASDDYKAAIDKMEICAAMVDAGQRECGALSERAARLEQQLQRCVGEGGSWSGGQCR